MPRQRRTIATAADTKTARWLDHALRTTNLHSNLKSAVSYRLPKSAAVGLDEDHVQNHYLRLLEQDALAKHVEADDAPAPSNMRWWAVKNAYKDIREWGREPTLRVAVGAMTETDLKRLKTTPPADVGHRQRSKEDTTFEQAVAAEQVVTMDIDAEDLLDDLRQRLEALHGDGCAHRHLTVVLAVSEGATIAEAANKAGCSTDDAKRMMAEVAEVMADK